MTKLIAAFILIIALYGGWHLFLYWEKVKNEDETAQQQAQAEVVMGDQLPGMPEKLQASYDIAQKHGVAGLKEWLKTYGQAVQDPRKAWIELDYCLLISQDNLPEARRVFAEVKQRTPESSPVWPRIKKLEKTYR